MGVEAFVLAGKDRIAEIGGHVLEWDDGAFLAMDAPDFSALAVENDRALGHLVNAVEIVARGADAVDDGQNHKSIEPNNGRSAEKPDKETLQRRKAPGQQEKEMEGPEK